MARRDAKKTARTPADERASQSRRKPGSPSRYAALHREIEGAFYGARCPDEDALVVSNDPRHLECVEIARAFRGKRWQDLTVEVLRYNHQSLSFMTPEAFRYFLPSYMLTCVDAYVESQNIPDSLIHRLIPPRPEGLELDDFLKKMSGFTAAQKRAIRSFIEYMIAKREGDDIQGLWPRALRRYWADAGR